LIYSKFISEDKKDADEGDSLLIGRAIPSSHYYVSHKIVLIKLNHRWPVKVKRKVVCSTRLLDNSGDQTLYQQGGTDHEQSIHDILGVVETLSEISF